MASEGPSENSDRLEELIEQFTESGYAAAGAEVDDGDGGHHHGHGHGPEPSVREFEYRGHTVRIVTHYEVSVDGEPWTRPMQVRPDGTVISHDLPQYVVPSATDLVRAVIDQGYEAPEEIRSMVEATKAEEG